VSDFFVSHAHRDKAAVAPLRDNPRYIELVYRARARYSTGK
jgi:hypothetical protein